MTGKQKGWLSATSILMFIFALFLIAFALIGHFVADLPDSLSFLSDFYNNYQFDFGFLGDTLSDYGILIFAGVPAIILLVCGILVCTKFNGGYAKYLVSVIISSVLIAVCAVLLLLNTTADSEIFKWVSFGIYLLFSILILVFSIVAVSIKGNRELERELEAMEDIDFEDEEVLFEGEVDLYQALEVESEDALAKDVVEEAEAVEPTEEVAGCETCVVCLDCETQDACETCEACVGCEFNGQEEESVQEELALDETDEIEKEIFENQPIIDQPVPVYTERKENESVSDIVSRVYGQEESGVVDYETRKKLAKVDRMYQLGVISKTEHDELSKRIKNGHI